jgi:hypothetical protein
MMPVKKDKENSDSKESDATICLPDRDARVAKRANYKEKKRKVELGYEFEDWIETKGDFLL